MPGLGRYRGSRHANDEAGSPSIAGHLDGTAVRLRNRAHDRQPESDSSRGAACLVKSDKPPKTRSRSAAGTPGPSSLIDSTTSVRSTVSITVTRVSAYRTALSSKLRTKCDSAAASPLTWAAETSPTSIRTADDSRARSTSAKTTSSRSTARCADACPRRGEQGAASYQRDGSCVRPQLVRPARRAASHVRRGVRRRPPRGYAVPPTGFAAHVRRRTRTRVAAGLPCPAGRAGR